MRTRHLLLAPAVVLLTLWCVSGPQASQAQTSDAIANTTEADESLWGDEARLVDVLSHQPAVRADPPVNRRYSAGELVEANVAVHPLPDGLMPSSSPLANLNLHYFMALGEVALVLPNSRIVLKVLSPAIHDAAGALSETAAEPQESAAVSVPRQEEAGQSEVPPALPRTAGPPAPASRRESPAAAATPDDTQQQVNIVALLDKAEAQRLRGDIMATRLLLERAVKLGSREAMRRLADTYDAEMLARWGAHGVRADQAHADRLYQAARAPVNSTSARVAPNIDR